MKNQPHFFQTIAEEAIMGIMAFDPDGKQCVYINRLAREALEMPMIDLAALESTTIPLVLSDLFPESRRAGLTRPFSEEMLRHEGLSQDVLLRKKNGLFMIANVGIKHIQLDGERSALLVMFQDITVQKKLQREVQIKQEEIHKAYADLLTQNQQLKALDLAKDKFIALTTHELRTPLAAIVSTAEVLELRLEETPEQKDQFIHTIHEQALHLMELVNDILDFAKIRAGKMDYYVEEVELAPLVQRIATNFEQMAAQANVSIETVPSLGSTMVWVDILRIREVINNVVNNAIKYNRSGGRVMIRLEHREAKIAICVTDTGPGIAADKIANVFNEFETVGSVARHHKGTGLGMPISKRLVQGMGGDLKLESQEGVGSTFIIELPVEKVLDESFYRSRPDAWGDLAAS